MPVLIAQGTGGDIRRLENYQGRFPEGSEGYVELEMRSKLATDIISWLDEKLDAVGVPANAVTVEGRFVKINFKTEIAPLVLIAGAIAAVIFLVALVVAWKLFKIEPEVVVGLATGVLILIAGAILLVIYLISIRGRLAAGPVMIGGK